MYCPKCAASNTDTTRFCRVCGANLSLVPQAMTGQLPEISAPGRRGHRRQSGPPNIGNGIQQFFVGIGFLMVAASVFLFAPAGRVWWFWLLLPAFGMLGKGIAEIVTVKANESLAGGGGRVEMPHAAPVENLPRRNTGELIPPPSVTEGTTRHLDATPDRDKYSR